MGYLPAAFGRAKMFIKRKKDFPAQNWGLVIGLSPSHALLGTELPEALLP
jgi:hypothetical protein